MVNLDCSASTNIFSGNAFFIDLLPSRCGLARRILAAR